MTDKPKKYVIDSNVLIEANRRYYSLDFAPAFWNFLIRSAKEGNVISIDKVYDEILNGKDNLAEWTKNKFSFAFAETKKDEKILEFYSTLMKWALMQDQFTQPAKDEFARNKNADAWIVAFAKIKGYVVVTQEVLDINIRKRIPIPNVCSEFKIEFMDTFQMLRNLNFKFQ